MIWKGIKAVFAWLLMALGIVRFIGIAAHFVVPGVSGPRIWSSSSPSFEYGFTIDCTTWWGILIHLSIALCTFAWGWGIVHDMKNKVQQSPAGDVLKAAPRQRSNVRLKTMRGKGLFARRKDGTLMT